MELVSTSNSFLGLTGYRVEPSGRIVPAWDSYERGDYMLKALPIAEKGSTTRYRVFAPTATLDLTSAGDECHVAGWESSEEPIAILKGFYSEMRDIPRLEALCGKKLEDVDAWLNKLESAHA